jgi:transposase-like protein
MEQNGNQNRRHYSPEQKVKILREHLENQVPLSDFAEEYVIHVNDLFNGLSSITNSSGAGSSYTYDANGNVISDSKDGIAFTI